MYQRKTHGGTFWENGRRYTILLEAELEPAQLRDQPTARTVDHEPVPADALSFSVQGVVWHATQSGAIDRRYSEGISYGQSVASLRLVKSARAQRMAELWDRWHLNDMRMNCVHFGDQTYHAGEPCPAGLPVDAPYVSGTAWLYEPIPADVLAELRALFGIPESVPVA